MPLSIILTMIGQFFSALAYVLMKIAHNRVGKEKSVYKDSYWWLGFFSMFFACGVQFFALGYGSQLLLASASTLTIIYNIMLSVVFLKEKLILLDKIAIFLMCAGSVIFVSHMSLPEDKVVTNEEVIILLTSPRSISYVVISFILISYANWKDYSAKKRLYGFYELQKQKDESIGLTDLVYNRVEALKNDQELQDIRSGLKTPQFLMPTTLGLAGGIMVTIMNCYTWTMQFEYFLVAISISIYQLRHLNKTISLYDQCETIPIYESSQILMNTTCSIVILQQADNLTFY